VVSSRATAFDTRNFVSADGFGLYDLNCVAGFAGARPNPNTDSIAS